MKSFKCNKCGFFFSVESDFEHMSKKEYEIISACPCGEQMEEVEYSEDMIPNIDVQKMIRLFFERSSNGQRNQIGKRP